MANVPVVPTCSGNDCFNSVPTDQHWQLLLCATSMGSQQLPPPITGATEQRLLAQDARIAALEQQLSQVGTGQADIRATQLQQATEIQNLGASMSQQLDSFKLSLMKEIKDVVQDSVQQGIAQGVSAATIAKPASSRRSSPTTHGTDSSMTDSAKRDTTAAHIASDKNTAQRRPTQPNPQVTNIDAAVYAMQNKAAPPSPPMVSRHRWPTPALSPSRQNQTRHK